MLRNAWHHVWRVLKWLFTPPRLIAILYFACIPFFALWYCRIPHGFYQSNIQFEAAYTDAANQVLNEACSSLAQRAAVPVAADPTKINFGEYWLNPSTGLRCDRMRIADNDAISFTMTVTLNRKEACPKVIRELCYDVNVIPFRIAVDPFDMKIGGPELAQFNPPLGEFAHALSFTVPNLSGFPHNGDIAPVVARRLFGEQDPPAIWFREDIDADIQKFLLAASGFTSDADDNWSRMVYFSAVTITTLGYGDIVPITHGARSLVTAEAIVGVILIGLFLNAIAKSRRPPPEMS
jgi:hypothetical protein